MASLSDTPQMTDRDPRKMFPCDTDPIDDLAQLRADAREGSPNWLAGIEAIRIKSTERLVRVTERLEAAVDRYARASDRSSTVMIWLTAAIRVLTVALLVLTALMVL